MDEKSAIQALDRLDPVLPLSPGRAERHGFEYFRHGTLSLYAALNISSGQVLGKTTHRHTSAEFVVFLADVVATQVKGKQIHIIADNLSTHKTKAVAEVSAAHPHVHLHFTPTYSSWLNQVEIWFSKIQRDFITRGIFTSKADLARKITRYIQSHNKSANPFHGRYQNTQRAYDDTISFICYAALATDSVVVEAHFDEHFAVELVAAVEDDRRVHELLDQAEVGVGDLLFVIIHTVLRDDQLARSSPRH